MIREAERMGLLVWSETPVYWTIEWENAETYANANKQLSESIARDKNRAAIILWSVANETPVGDFGFCRLSGCRALPGRHATKGDGLSHEEHEIFAGGEEFKGV
jgi:beta-galactosidase/beta-glucuronidase